MYTMASETPSHLYQSDISSYTTTDSSEDGQRIVPPSCMFPQHHNSLIRNLDALERALVDERRRRRELDMGYTTLIVDIAVWTLTRLEADYQFRVNNSKSTFWLNMDYCCSCTFSLDVEGTFLKTQETIISYCSDTKQIRVCLISRFRI